jgi:hypothetical protein
MMDFCLNVDVEDFGEGLWVALVWFWTVGVAGSVLVLIIVCVYCLPLHRPKGENGPLVLKTIEQLGLAVRVLIRLS